MTCPEKSAVKGKGVKSNWYY